MDHSLARSSSGTEGGTLELFSIPIRFCSLYHPYPPALLRAYGEKGWPIAALNEVGKFLFDFRTLETCPKFLPEGHQSGDQIA
jgi:hypothetical protein